jgi:hypothetical protein
VNFQVTVLKILATSGRYWADRTRRLAARVPELDIWSQGLVERINGGWRLTSKGREVLELMEARPTPEPVQALAVNETALPTVEEVPASAAAARGPCEAAARTSRRPPRGANEPGRTPPSQRKSRQRSCAA